MVMKERDEELALFLEMRRIEKEKNNQFSLLNSSNDLDSSLGPNGNGFPVREVVTSVPARKTAADKFLNSEKEKSEYDWLLTPPKTPLFPNLDDSQRTRMSQNGMSNARPTALKSRFDNLQEEPAPRNALAVRNGNLMTRQNSSSSNSRSFSDQRPSSSGSSRSASRTSTPTSRPTIPAATKPSRSSTPTSRVTLPSTRPGSSSARSSTPTSRATLPSTKPTASSARSSTPTSRATLSSTKPAASSARSSTPTSRATLSSTRPTVSSARSSTPTRTTARSSTPTARPSITTTTTTSRSATPTRRATPSGAPSTAAPPGSSSSATNSGPAPSRGTSPTVRSRPWNPSEMPGFSLETPPNLRTSLPERPTSASRGRPGAPSSRSSSVEPSSNGRPRRQSCSPSRSRTSSGISRGRRVDSNSCDSDSPGTIGTKMVERVVNMRKLAPPKQDYNLSNSHYGPGKLSTSMDSSGFGSNFSKKSLDMAMRHMDFRRSMSSNNRPLMTNVPASSIYSVRSGSTKSRSVSVTDSPLATSSNCSEPSVNNDSSSLYGREIDHL